MLSLRHILRACGPIMRSLGWDSLSGGATWSEITGRTPTWTVIDADAGDLGGPTDWDETGQSDRRYDEPQDEYTAVDNPTTEWTRR